MFDAFGVHFRHAFRNAKAAEESDDSLVASFASGRKRSPLFSKKNCPVRLRSDEAGLLQPSDGPIDGDVSHTETFGEIDDARFAQFGDQVGDGLDIILGNLVGMFAASLRKVLSLAFGARTSFFCCRF